MAAWGIAEGFFGYLTGDEEYLVDQHHVAVRFPDGSLRVGEYGSRESAEEVKPQEPIYQGEMTPRDEPHLIRLATPVELAGPAVLGVFGEPFLELLAKEPEARWFYERARQAPVVNERHSTFRFLPMSRAEYLHIQDSLAAPAFKRLSAFFAREELGRWEELQSTYTLWLHTDKEAYSTVERVALAMAFETLRKPERAEELLSWASFFAEDSKLFEAAVLAEIKRLLKST